MHALSCFGYTHPTVLQDHEHIYLYVLLFESEAKSFLLCEKEKAHAILHLKLGSLCEKSLSVKFWCDSPKSVTLCICHGICSLP